MVECDSSDFANGVIISQYIDGKWHPVTYRSRTLSEMERNYEIHDKELMAVMDSLSDWRQYLLGARWTFEIWTDHQNLQYFRKPQKLNCRQASWQTELQEYNFLLVHKLGAQMKKANLLTHRADFKMGKDDNKDIVLLKDKLFVGNIQVEPIAEDLMRRIQKVRANRVRAVAKALEEAQLEWVQQENGTVTW